MGAAFESLQNRPISSSLSASCVHWHVTPQLSVLAIHGRDFFALWAPPLELKIKMKSSFRFIPATEK